jgi:hypothetical protein
MSAGPTEIAPLTFAIAAIIAIIEKTNIHPSIRDISWEIYLHPIVSKLDAIAFPFGTMASRRQMVGKNFAQLGCATPFGFQDASAEHARLFRTRRCSQRLRQIYYRNLLFPEILAKRHR